MSSKTAKVLTEVLANSYMLLIKKQNYHWNVKGSNFFSLHEMFGNQYEEQFTAIDGIAERIRALGEHATGSVSEYSEISKIKDDRNVGSSSTQMLQNLILDEKAIIGVISNAAKVTQGEGDELSTGMLVERLQVHEKNLWMLESSLG